MIKGKCNYCGENFADCECYNEDEWYCFDDVKPSPGQKCLVKSTQILEAYYSPKFVDEFYVTGCKEVGEITSWRPLFD